MAPPNLTLGTIQTMLDSTLRSLFTAGRSPEEQQAQQEAATAALGALKPADAEEAMIAARTVTMHFASVECSRRAALPDVPDAMMMKLLVTAGSLSRQSTALASTLHKRHMARRASRPEVTAADLAAANAVRDAAPGRAPAQDDQAVIPQDRAYRDTAGQNTVRPASAGTNGSAGTAQPKAAAQPGPHQHAAPPSVTAGTRPPAGAAQPNAVQSNAVIPTAEREQNPKPLSNRGPAPHGEPAAPDRATIQARLATARDALLGTVSHTAMRQRAG